MSRIVGVGSSILVLGAALLICSEPVKAQRALTNCSELLCNLGGNGPLRNACKNFGASCPGTPNCYPGYTGKFTCTKLVDIPKEGEVGYCLPTGSSVAGIHTLDLFPPWEKCPPEGALAYLSADISLPNSAGTCTVNKCVLPLDSLDVKRGCKEVNCKNTLFGDYANPKDCASYCRCSYGNSHYYACDPGLHFDTLLKVCDKPDVAKCSPKNGK